MNTSEEKKLITSLSKLINRLLARMYEMNLISDANENSLYDFLYEYYVDLRYFNMF